MPKRVYRKGLLLIIYNLFKLFNFKFINEKQKNQILFVYDNLNLHRVFFIFCWSTILW